MYLKIRPSTVPMTIAGTSHLKLSQKSCSMIGFADTVAIKGARREVQDSRPNSLNP